MVKHPSPAACSRSTTVEGSGGLVLAASVFAVDAAACGAEVVFAHGFGQTRGAWSRTGQFLAAHGHRGFSYDARGHGGSQRNPDGLPYGGDQFADDLIIVAGERAQPPVLVGASMGGLFGLIAESRWPGLFRALVLVDVTPRWERAGLERILGFMTAFPQGFDSLAHAAEVIAAYLPHRQGRKSPEELRELLREGADGRWRWHWDPRLIADMASGMEGHQDMLADAARAVGCPVLLISGGRSDLVSARTVEDFQSLVPHARHVQLSQATHMLAGDDNDAFTATVLEYLTALPPVAIEPAPSAGPSAVTESVSGARP
jgi:pimeloyl-ACP methyl ester carboxylesterase